MPDSAPPDHVIVRATPGGPPRFTPEPPAADKELGLPAEKDSLGEEPAPGGLFLPEPGAVVEPFVESFVNMPPAPPRSRPDPWKSAGREPFGAVIDWLAGHGRLMSFIAITATSLVAYSLYCVTMRVSELAGEINSGRQVGEQPEATASRPLPARNGLGASRPTGVNTSGNNNKAIGSRAPYAPPPGNSATGPLRPGK